MNVGLAMSVKATTHRKTLGHHRTTHRPLHYPREERREFDGEVSKAIGTRIMEINLADIFARRAKCHAKSRLFNLSMMPASILVSMASSSRLPVAWSAT